jgi:hypothetical protein
MTDTKDMIVHIVQREKEMDCCVEHITVQLSMHLYSFLHNKFAFTWIVCNTSLYSIEFEKMQAAGQGRPARHLQGSEVDF